MNPTVIGGTNESIWIPQSMKHDFLHVSRQISEITLFQTLHAGTYVFHSHTF